MFVLLCCICFFFLSNNINSVSLDLLRQSSQGPGSTPWPYRGYGQNRDTTNKQVFVGLLGCWPIILLVKIFQLNWLVPVLPVIESGQTEYTEYRDVFLWSFEEHWVWRWFSIHDPPVFWLGKRPCLCDANQSVILCMLLLYLARPPLSPQIYCPGLRTLASGLTEINSRIFRPGFTSRL